MKKTIVLTEWFQNFNRPGGNCGLTCCTEDWKIVLTEQELEKYKNIDTDFGKN